MSGEVEVIKELKEGMPLFIEISGQRVPFFIEEIEPDFSGKRCSVKFEFIESDSEAKKYLGCDVFSDIIKSDSSEKGSEITKLIGFEIFDQVSGSYFVVDDVIKHPGNTLLVIKNTTGSKSSGSKEFFLPAAADYITKINRDKKTIIAEFPAGLIDD